MIIDAHAHIGRLPGALYNESHEKNLSLILKEAEENKVDALIIIAGRGGEDVFNISTENLLALVAGHKNIYTVAGIDIDYKKEYLHGLEEWMKEKRIVGVKFYTGYQHFYPEDERCIPVYHLCEKYNIPAIFHSGDTLSGSVPNPKIKYSHPIHIDDAAVNFPHLKIIIAHMGNPWLIDCAEILYKNPNVYADISGLVIGDELDTAYGEIMKKRIKELIEYIEPEFKLLYGTDWPLCHMGQYIKFAKALDIKSENLEKLFSANAKKLFNIH